MTAVMTTVISNRRSPGSKRAARRVPNREIPRHELRDRIQSTALRLFHERGFDATPVDEIVAAAGVAKGTFFNFYPTKQAVLARYYEQLDSFMAGELQRLDPAHPATTSATMINQVIRGVIGFQGLLMSDDVSMNALAGSIAERVNQSSTSRQTQSRKTELCFASAFMLLRRVINCALPRRLRNSASTRR